MQNSTAESIVPSLYQVNKLHWDSSHFQHLPDAFTVYTIMKELDELGSEHLLTDLNLESLKLVALALKAVEVTINAMSEKKTTLRTAYITINFISTARIDRFKKLRLIHYRKLCAINAIKPTSIYSERVQIISLANNFPWKIISVPRFDQEYRTNYRTASLSKKYYFINKNSSIHFETIIFKSTK